MEIGQGVFESSLLSPVIRIIAFPAKVGSKVTRG